MIFQKKCPVCRKNKWGVKIRSYIAPQVSPMPITSVAPLCRECFENVQYLTIHKKSLRHWYRYAIIYLTNLLKP
jgi:hypothetical protein